MLPRMNVSETGIEGAAGDSEYAEIHDESGVKTQ